MLGANASMLEATWLGIALLGAAVALALWVQIVASYLAVETWIGERRLVRWGPRHKFILGFLIGIFLFLLVWLGFIALGVNAVTNPPPATPDRVEAAERGGMILCGLEGVLLLVTVILTWAWITVGKPTLNPSGAPRSPVSQMFRAIDLSREMGHTVRNDSQRVVALLDDIARDHALSPDYRSRATEALLTLAHMTTHVTELHQAVKRLEGDG